MYSLFSRKTLKVREGQDLMEVFDKAKSSVIDYISKERLIPHALFPLLYQYKEYIPPFVALSMSYDNFD